MSIFKQNYHLLAISKWPLLACIITIKFTPNWNWLVCNFEFSKQFFSPLIFHINTLFSNLTKVKNEWKRKTFISGIKTRKKNLSIFIPDKQPLNDLSTFCGKSCLKFKKGWNAKLNWNDIKKFFFHFFNLSRGGEWNKT